MKKSIKKSILLLFVLGLIFALAACGSQKTVDEKEIVDPEPVEEAAYIDSIEIAEVMIEDEAVALADAPAAMYIPTTTASGIKALKAGGAVIDYSNATDGYVMVRFENKIDKKLKVQIKGPTTTYTYNIVPQEWESFPLSDGNGSYKVTVYKNVSGSSYSNVCSTTISVALKDEFAPFTHSNQYVDYDNAPASRAKAEELLANETDDLKKIGIVYDYVVKNFTYDKEKAKTVQSGYLPVIDNVLNAKKGICFDYAAIMTGMLRSQGVPCKLVVGYAGTAYHAWISVYSDGGWINNAITFDGTTWHRMDPTFASSSKQSASIMKYIGDGNNYSAKYFY